MNAHKFSVGQTVLFWPGKMGSAVPKLRFKVVRLLPAEQNDQQYRIKSEADGHERVAKESQLR